GMESAVVPACFAGDGRVHGEEGVIWVDAAKRADLLHVVGPAADDRTGFEEALQRLKIPHAVVPELRDERARVEVQPGWLKVGDHAEPREHVDGFVAHEVTMRDARA